jgi:hypothetical protein
MVLVVEQMQCLTIWMVKACILIMYHRLTMSLRQNLAVKIVAGYVFLSRCPPFWPSQGRTSVLTESQASSSWKFYTSESGAAPLTSTGQCLPTAVCFIIDHLRVATSAFVLTGNPL